MKTVVFNILLMFITVLTVSCEYKDLCYTHPHTMKVRVEFDWPLSESPMPRWMEVWLIPVNGGNTLHYQIRDYKNAVINIPPSKYKAICYNGDTHNIYEYKTDDYYSFLLTTYNPANLSDAKGNMPAGTLPHTEELEEQNTTNQPETMLSDHLDDVDIMFTDKEQVIVFTPTESTIDVTVTIKNVENISSTSGLSCSLSGMSSGLYVGRGICVQDSVILLSDITVIAPTTLQARFYSFGHCEGITATHVFTLYAQVDDGTKKAYLWNVTEIMHCEKQDKRHIHIILDGVNLPENIASGNGMNPYVDSWLTEWIEIN